MIVKVNNCTFVLVLSPFLSSGNELISALQTEPVEATVEGKVPTWIHGSFIRNGPGTFQGMKHLFDGYAMLAKFAFENGTVKVSHR